MQEQQRRWRIGVFIEWLSDGYSDPIFDAIVTAAGEHEVDIICFVGWCDGRDYPVTTRHMPAAYASPKSIDGAVVVSVGNSLGSSEIEKYFERLAPLPLCSVAVQWSGLPSVDVDNQTGVRAGVRHLIRKHGRRKIAYIRGPASSTEAEKRFAAYREVLDEAGIEFDPTRVTIGYYVHDSGVQAVTALMDERQVEFDAVVAANDAMALGAMEELERRGIAVPTQVSVFGFDDVEVGRHARPPLTTVRQPVRRHGRKAFEIVLEQLRGNPVPLHTEIDSDLVLRKSCGCMSARAHMHSTAPKAESDSIERRDLDSWLKTTSQKLNELFPDRAPPGSVQMQIAEHLRKAIESDDGRSFLERMERHFDQLSHSGTDLLLSLPQIDAIRKSCQNLAVDAQAVSSLDQLLLELSILASEMAERAQAQFRHRGVALVDRLLRMNEALLQTRTFDEVARVIASELTSLGVGGCYVCVWEGDAVPAARARLVLGCEPGKPCDVPSEGIAFDAFDLLPPGFAQTLGTSAWLVCPMARREDRITGYIVLIRGTAESFVYDGLVDQIASSFKRLELTRQVVEEVQLREAAERQRIEREMRIATEIQTGILPRQVRVSGLEISCSMLPATEVGGDYYDVISVADGCWIGIGDVAGHGLPTGLVMLMCQSVIGGLVRSQPTATASKHLTVANQLLYDNIRLRLRQDEHITLALICYHNDGRLEFAGAHESILVWRASSGTVEHIELDGVWSGILDDIEAMTHDSAAKLCPGDLLVLYTDGITEARNVHGEAFGEARLVSCILSFHDDSPDQIREKIFQSVLDYAEKQDDDMTLVVARFNGV